MPMIGMDRPPLPPPDVQAQMGAPAPPPSPAAGVSVVRPAGAGPMGRQGPANPHGFMMAQVEAVKKVLDQIANAEPVFAPFAQKAIQMLESGVSAISTAPSESSAGPEGEGGGASSPTPPGGAGQMPPMG